MDVYICYATNIHSIILKIGKYNILWGPMLRKKFGLDLTLSLIYIHMLKIAPFQKNQLFSSLGIILQNIMKSVYMQVSETIRSCRASNFLSFGTGFIKHHSI